MMKNLVKLLTLTLAIFLLGSSHIFAADKKDEDKTSDLLTKLEDRMSEEGLSYDDLDKVGNFYFDNGSIVFQIDEDNKDKVSVEKTKKVAASFQGVSRNISNFNIVKYSYDQLADYQDSIAEYLESEYPDIPYTISMETKDNQLKLTIQKISTESEKYLNELYGEALTIKVDPSLDETSKYREEATKSRKSDFNSLGAGIGIKLRALNDSGVEVLRNCSTAGVAHNGKGSYWLMSAGHCNDHNLTPFYQYDAFLGSTYKDFEGSGYDFLLIETTSSNLSRRASNGLYSSVATTENGYDSSLQGELRQKLGLPVCKVGITTGRTCGKVTNERTRQNGNKVSFVVRDGGNILSAGGDSGGAWFTQSLPQRLVGIHWGGSDQVIVNGERFSTTSYAGPWIEIAQHAGIYLYTSNTSVPIN